MEHRMHIITLGVSDLKRAETFYSEGLGCKKSALSQESIVFYPLGSIVLALYPKHLLEEDATVTMTGSGHPPLSLAYNVQSEADVDAVLKKAVTAGAMLIKPAQKVFWGGYSGYFADPDGFLWEVAHNPFFTFDSNQNLVL
jgi:uncharacterized protein